jgi:hypothetical protein
MHGETHIKSLGYLYPKSVICFGFKFPRKLVRLLGSAPAAKQHSCSDLFGCFFTFVNSVMRDLQWCHPVTVPGLPPAFVTLAVSTTAGLSLYISSHVSVSV